MPYRLVVSEKPSVAMAYAKVLGVTNRKDGYLEGGGYLVSWCIGHLVELAPPNIYDEKYVKWSIADLPIRYLHTKWAQARLLKWRHRQWKQNALVCVRKVCSWFPTI